MNNSTGRHGSDDLTSSHDSGERLIVMTMGCAALLLIGLFTIFRFENGNYVMAAIDALTVCALCATVLLSRFEKDNSFSPMALLVILSAVAIFASIELGIAGLLWAYPLLSLYFFMLSLRVATLASLILLGILISIFFNHSDPIFNTVGEHLSYLATCCMAAIQAAIFSTVTHRRRRLLEYGVTCDSLTGALNRRAMESELKRAIAARDRHSSPSCLLAMDLDHFKQVNDTHGHKAGDQVLIDFVDVINQGLRCEDQLFRIGGEEFIVLLRDTDIEGMKHVEALLHQRIRSSLHSPGRPITMSVGGAQLRAREDAEQWLGRADKHLYQAKAEGRDTTILDQPNCEFPRQQSH